MSSHLIMSTKTIMTFHICVISKTDIAREGGKQPVQRVRER